MLLMTLKSVKLIRLERGLCWPPASFLGLEWHLISFLIRDLRFRFRILSDCFWHFMALRSDDRLQTFESSDITPLRPSRTIELRQLTPSRFFSLRLVDMVPVT